MPSHGTRNKVGEIVGGIIGSFAAIFAVIGIVTFVQRQRRWKSKWNRPRSIFSTDSIQAGPGMIVTPFDPNYPEGITTEQHPFITEEPSAETVALRHLFSSPPAPFIAGLSDKELARLRAEALTSQPDNPQNSTPNVSQSTSYPTAVAQTGGGALPSDTRRLYSEVESLRQEMERLRAEGLVVAAPPSYTEGNG